MKILHLTRTLDARSGGPIEGIRQLVQAHAQRGHASLVASLDAPGPEVGAGFPCPCIALGPARGGYGYAASARAWLSEQAPAWDAAIVHGLWQYQGRLAWQVLRHQGMPYAVFPHGMLDPWFRRAYPLKHCKKTVYWWACERRVLRDAAAVLFTTAEEQRLAAHAFSLPPLRAAVVGFGTRAPADSPADRDGQRQAFLAAHPALTDRRLLLFLGRLHAKKGCDLLVQAFIRGASRDPDLDLVMAGPDPDGWQERLAPVLSAAGLQARVHWTGMLAGEVKWGAFRTAEAFILPSHQENFGVAVAEALACGCPVLISNQVNIHGEVTAGGAGLVASDDLDGTSWLLDTWRSMDRCRRQDMASRARTLFAARFTIDACADAVLAVLDGARAARARPTVYDLPGAATPPGSVL